MFMCRIRSTYISPTSCFEVFRWETWPLSPRDLLSVSRRHPSFRSYRFRRGGAHPLCACIGGPNTKVSKGKSRTSGR